MARRMRKSKRRGKKTRGRRKLLHSRGKTPYAREFARYAAGAAVGGAFEYARRNFGPAVRKRVREFAVTPYRPGPPKKKKVTVAATGNALSISKRKVHMARYKLSRTVRSMRVKMLDRFQNLTNFDTNRGGLDLWNHVNGDGQIWTPVHVYDLSCRNDIRAGNRYAWGNSAANGADLTTAAFINEFPIPGTDPAGATTTLWVMEDNPGSTAQNDLNMTLDWVNVRMNLYGARKRTTKFVVTFFTYSDEDSDPFDSAANNDGKRMLFSELERPFIFSNLQQRQRIISKRMRIIKEFNYSIEPVTSIDLNTVTGNIHEANIFLRINKILDYHWPSTNNTMIAHAVDDGDDYITRTADNSQNSRVYPSKRVYMMVRCFAPERTEGPASAAADPSYDIVMRRQRSANNY